MRSKSFRSLLRQYILFFLCVCLLFIPLYVQTYGLVQEQEKDSAASQLQKGAESLDEQVSALFNIIQLTYTDRRYRVLTYENADVFTDNMYQLPAIVSNFKSLLSANTSVTDGGILLSDDIILTRYRSFVRNEVYSFYPDYLRCGDMTGSEWESRLRDVLPAGVSYGFLPAANYISNDFGSYQAITFVGRWCSTATVSATSIFYATIRIDNALRFLISDDLRGSANLTIRDATGQIIYGQDNGAEQAKPITVSAALPKSGLMVEVLIPNDLISQRMHSLRVTLMIYLILVLAVGLAIALFSAYKSSRPIQNMVQTVQHLVNNPDASPSTSEYDYITGTVTQLNQTLTDYGTQLQEQKKRLRANLFEKAALRGLYGADSLADFQRLFPDFPAEWRLAAVEYALPDGVSTLDAAITVETALMHQLCSGLPETVYAQSIGERFILLVLPQPVPNPDFWIELLTRLSRECGSSLSIQPRMALSESFTDPGSLSAAYGQLRRILYLSRSNSELEVWQLQNFPQRPARVSIDYMQLQQLHDSIMGGDEESVQALLQAIRQALLEPENQTGFAQQHTNDSLQQLLRQLYHENPDVFAEVPDTTPGDDSQAIEDVLNTCAQMAHQMNQQLQQHSDQFSVSICTYIDAHFRDEEFYAQTVCDEFHISAATLQRVIKEATGKTFFKYLEDLRLEEAYTLLKGSEFSVNEIAAKCGFSSPNSFYKAFKRRYTFAPSVLREHPNADQAARS